MAIRHSLQVGTSFGLTSGIITTLGLMVGLHSGTNSRLAVLGGILTIAIADAMSDALGIHISEESENRHSTREIWETTAATFLSKFLLAMTMVVPLLLFSLANAILINIVWGLTALAVLSYIIAVAQKVKPTRIVIEHIAIALIVLFVTHYLGHWISSRFS